MNKNKQQIQKSENSERKTYLLQKHITNLKDDWNKENKNDGKTKWKKNQN